MLRSNLSVTPVLVENHVRGSCGQRIDLRMGSDPHETVGPEHVSSARSNPSLLAAGMLLGERYRIVHQVGRGGMGDVYQAEDLILEQTVALKSFPDWIEQNRNARERFYREVKLARQISHPNVCRVFDIGNAEGLSFITMEFVGGEDLQALLTRIGRFTYSKALEVACQICAGLTAAHDQSVLHRDLKPANIMLDERGNVRITDFGLAAMAGEAGYAGSGTPIYMAPEQLRGQEASVRTDLYAVGLVLYEIFTGTRPFTMESAAEAARSGDSLRPLPNNNLDPALERVILLCLDPNPAKRPCSAMEVAAALTEAYKSIFKGARSSLPTGKRNWIEQVTPIGWAVGLTMLIGWSALLLLVPRPVHSDLFTWAWDMILQSLMTSLCIFYLLRRGLKAS